jgi:phosphoribosyl-ATP pyrophosphohydrolase/phosphoribosyl-AMP cyclohydrolase
MDFTKLNGLIPAVAQDDETGEVLMLGFMNDEALQRTLDTGFATFYSRSRRTLWLKGETSGNRLAVRRVLTDCDDDSVVLRVVRQGDGNVCHTGTRSCFTRELTLTRASGDSGPAFGDPGRAFGDPRPEGLGLRTVGDSVRSPGALAPGSLPPVPTPNSEPGGAA